MKQFILLVFILILLTLRCDLTDLPEDNTIPGRRDYEWTVDTLNMPMNVITGIWGSSPQDVWATGAGGTEADRLWHYDGAHWTPYLKEIIYCRGETLYGFSQNNVWMGGAAGWLGRGAAIWHFDGSTWTQNFIYNVEGSYASYVSDLWGSSPNDIYACGLITFYNEDVEIWRGFVLHYDGSNWEEIFRANFNSQFLRIRKEGNNIFILSYETKIDNEFYAFYKLKDNQLINIYSQDNFRTSFALIKGLLYFLVDNNICLYRNNIFEKQFSIDNSAIWGIISGKNSKDIFFSMNDGLVQYNGIDFQYIYNYQPTNIFSSVLFEKEVFFTLWNGAISKNMVLRGRLNN